VNRARLLLVDDHTILREGVRALLELEQDFEIVGDAGALSEAVEATRRLRPDLILTDLSLPCSTGAQAIAEMKRHCPSAKVLVLTVHNTEEHIRSALAAGASGYVLKDASRAELVRAARAVLAGERHLCTRSSARMLRAFLGEEPAPRPAVVANVVTGRERQIVAMIARGASTKRIAGELSLSIKTVEKHRANLMRKLGVRNVAGVTRFAIDSGLVGRTENDGWDVARDPAHVAEAVAFSAEPRVR
jgi:DNA-binding NarL/FixJ family response regulator